MREKKRQLAGFEWYDSAGVAAHLSEMAAQGWLLADMGVLLWTYERGEPQEAVYGVADADEEALWQAYEAAGWQLAASSEQWRVYRAGEDVQPVTEDAAVRQRRVRRYWFGNCLANGMHALSIIAVLGLMWLPLLDRPAQWISNGWWVHLGLLLVAFLLKSLQDLAFGLVWYSQA